MEDGVEVVVREEVICWKNVFKKCQALDGFVASPIFGRRV